MLPFPFALLYLGCLALCLGGIEALRHGWSPEAQPPPPQSVDEVRVIAVPPRPEGVRPVQGEGEEGYEYTEQRCLELSGQYHDICFQQLARQRAPTDLEGGLQACKQIADVDTALECAASVAELYSPVDRDLALAVCPTIERKKWRDQCVFGIALALAHPDPEYAFALCDRAGQWRDFCRHDVNGEISQFDVQRALGHCAAEQGDLLTRKSCWHGIGKYVARVDVDLAFQTCAGVPVGPEDLYIENCYHGLGWGAAEAAGAGFVSSCARAGTRRDSCLLGVAYNLRRFDIDAGLRICSQVQRPDLAQRCERFVRDGRL